MRLGTQPTGAPDPHRTVTKPLTPEQRRRIWATERLYAVWPFGDTCLRRALVMGHHLRDQSPVLRIGVTAGRSEPVAAHAWVETADVTLLALPGYETLNLESRSAVPAAP
jgi:hypothetical protein